ncbi:hypothetical protein [Calothrix sp. 336/3]|uniref:hypothetical protein n=1 Tax=Calothrix sp. 336/3 TaxID=1337936 RepID=UPI0004E456A7|nr:hypothetical protein [Calothrix sp. 336/3]AKG21670.1 hypothetical protein IJ00_10735 [Calothrix sp. 336/3]
MKKIILVSSLFAAQMLLLPAFAAPTGSYTQSCRNIKTNIRPGLEPTLEAECLDKRGQWKYTRLVGYRSCNAIDNDNGRLVCRK